MAPAWVTRGGLGVVSKWGARHAGQFAGPKTCSTHPNGGAYWQDGTREIRIPARCPMCGRTGLADMSDDKSHKVGDYDTRVEAVTQGFEIRGKDVICSACQVSAL
jgi:hypothetical protein